MYETTSYDVVGGEVADEVKDEEKQIDVTGVEVALDERPPEPPLADAPPPPPSRKTSAARQAKECRSTVRYFFFCDDDPLKKEKRLHIGLMAINSVYSQ